MKGSKDEIQKYFKKQKKVLLKFSENNNFTAGEKNVHELRVAIKKLRILFSLFEKRIGKRRFSATKFYDKLNSLFKAAGKVRECQVNIERMAKYHHATKTVSEYEKFLQQKELKFKKTLRKRLRQIKGKAIDKAGDAIKKELEKKGSKKTGRSIKKFILSERKKAIRLIKSGMKQSEKFHDSRKHLKAVDITAGLLTGNRKLKKLGNDVSATEELIGSWHDNEMLHDSFRNYIDYIRLKKEYRPALFTNVENEITAKSRDLLQAIKTKLKDPETAISKI